MYGEYGVSSKQKITFTFLHSIIIGFIYWLMFLNGISFFANMFGFPISIGELIRRDLIFLGACVYFIKEFFIEYVFLKRKVRWCEALTLSLWLFIAYTTFSFTGGSNARPLGSFEYSGIVLFVGGLFVNTFSEYRRYLWRKKPQNTGKLYTGGLFSLSRHINYLGDLLLFIGFAMFTGRVWPFVIPAAMMVLFVVVNIPMLEHHLHDKFGGEYDEYAKHSKKLIPFVY